MSFNIFIIWAQDIFLPSTLPGKATECPQYMEEGCFDKRFYVPLHFGNARKL